MSYETFALYVAPFSMLVFGLLIFTVAMRSRPE